MFATIRSYRVSSGCTDAVMHRIDRDFAEAISQEPGFISYQALEIGNDMIMTISNFATTAQAQASNDLAAEWVSDALADLGVHRIGLSGGEVMVSRASSGMLVPTGH